jgi:L-alanine-DL-glutamate epimerase-like enolase superfamily enzyme
MKITRLETVVQHSRPSANPIRDALQSLPGSGSVQVTVHADDEIAGVGDASFGRIAGAPDALAAVIEHELKPIVIGTDPSFVRQTHAAMLKEIEYQGVSGLTMMGIAAIDQAIWDCLGKIHKVPCWKLWGAAKDRIPAYAMVGWLNYDDAQVKRICAQAVSQGFRAVKIKVGFPTLAEDIKRVKTVREAIGPEIKLMVDANQSLTTAEAIVRGKAFEDLGCAWWEEPIPADDIDGYVQLNQALTIPIAAGENIYTRADFARFLKREALDIVQVDLRRAGGPTALLEIGWMADAFHRPYASHGGGPVQLNIMACLPNAMYLETGLMGQNSPMKLVDGAIPIPQGAGFSW